MCDLSGSGHPPVRVTHDLGDVLTLSECVERRVPSLDPPVPFPNEKNEKKKEKQGIPSNTIPFMTVIASKSGSLHCEFVFLLFIQTHRETDLFFADSGVFFVHLRRYPSLHTE